MYVHTCWKRRDTASDNGVASRQRKSSHEKCTPRRNLPDNKVEREENRTRDHTVPLFRSTPLSLSLLLSSFFSLSSSLFFSSFSLFTQRLGGSASRPQVRRFTKFFDYPFVRGRKTVRLLPGITAFSAEDTHRRELIRQRVRDTSSVLYSLPACMLLPGCIMKIAECSICKESRSIERCVMVLRNYTFRGEGVYAENFLLFYSSRSLAFPLSNHRS